MNSKFEFNQVTYYFFLRKREKKRDWLRPGRFTAVITHLRTGINYNLIYYNNNNNNFRLKCKYPMLSILYEKNKSVF